MGLRLQFGYSVSKSFAITALDFTLLTSLLGYSFVVLQYPGKHKLFPESWDHLPQIIEAKLREIMGFPGFVTISDRIVGSLGSLYSFMGLKP